MTSAKRVRKRWLEINRVNLAIQAPSLLLGPIVSEHFGGVNEATNSIKLHALKGALDSVSAPPEQSGMGRANWGRLTITELCLIL